LQTTDSLGTAAINLTGNEFENSITGNAATNIIDGGAGADAMAGLSGNDTYIVDNVGDFVWENVGEGTRDRVQTSVTYVLTAGSEIEILETTNSRSVAAIDLFGNELDNTIIGNDGQNNLVGGLGRDTMTGRAGGDVFTWTSTAETGVTAATADVIVDFSRPKGDLIALNLIDANTMVAGNQAFTFIGTDPFTAPGQVRTFTDATDTYILLNTDKDLDAEAMIRVLGVHTVDASWFVL